jgi:cholesterol oxidase
VKAVVRKIPTVMMLDDHEIWDNWEPVKDDPRPRDSLKPGVEAYKDFPRRAGPPFRIPCQGSVDPLWFKHAIGNVSLFVADTRTERRVRDAATSEDAQIMGACQHADLLEWLWQLQNDPATADAPKFVASPSILLPRKLEMDMTTFDGGVTKSRASMARTLRSDSWQGYPWSMHSVLHHIVSEGIRNVVFLSGDEHRFCLARARIARLGGPGARQIHSVHSSPLYAPFTFANAARAEFPSRDRFTFVAPGNPVGPTYRCRVAAVFPRIQSGLAEILVYEQGGVWTVKVGFHDANPAVPTEWHTL